MPRTWRCSHFYGASDSGRLNRGSSPWSQEHIGIASQDDVMKEDHAQRMFESLDNPIWFALTTEHRTLARSHGVARRYPPGVSPLAALLHPTNEAFADLRPLVSPGEHVALFTASSLDVPRDWQVDRSRCIDQMICEASVASPPVACLHSGRQTFPKCWSSPLPPSPARSCHKPSRWEVISGYVRAMGGWSQWLASDYNRPRLRKSALYALTPTFAAVDMRGPLRSSSRLKFWRRERFPFFTSSLRMARKWSMKKLDSVYVPRYI